jgi:hypothetical protein
MKRAAFLCKSHPDFHLPADVEVGRDFDGRAYARRLKACGADAVAFFAKCHYGHSYYPTKVGTMHPGLRTDLLRAVLDGCRAEGIGLVCYYSVFLDTAAVRAHPDWALRAASNAVDAGFDSRAFLPLCVNSPYADELLLPQCLEVIGGYDIDELLFDTMTGFQPCHCARCRGAFGRDIPASAADPHWLDYVRWYADRFRSFFARVAQTLERARPGLPIAFNWEWSHKRPQAPPAGIARLVGDLIPTPAVASLEARYWAGTGYPFDYMCGRFLHGLGDWNSNTPETLRVTAAASIANGGGFYLIDRQLPDGALEPRAFALMRDVFGWVQARRGVVEGAAHVPEIAVLDHYDHVMGPDLRFFPDAKQKAERLKPYEGAARLFMEHARHYTGLSAETMLRRLGAYRLAIVPEQEFLGDALPAALARFVRRGGALLVTQSPTPDGLCPALLELAGIDVAGFTELEYGYVDERRDGRPYPLLTRGRHARAVPRRGTRVLHARIAPLAAGKGGAQFGHGFAPPGAATGEAAVTLRRVGRGAVAYVAAPVFKSYWDYQDPCLAALLLRVIDALLPDPLVRVETPAQVEMSAARKGEDLVVHLVNHSGKERLGGYWSPVTEYIPEIRGIRVAVRGLTSRSRVRREPAGRAVAVRARKGGGEWRATLGIMESFVVPRYFRGRNGR